MTNASIRVISASRVNERRTLRIRRSMAKHVRTIVVTWVVKVMSELMYTPRSRKVVTVGTDALSMNTSPIGLGVDAETTSTTSLQWFKP